jgi:CRISPR/Cas system endoribonuclease Cas6 (RAMP superfamily)
MRKSSSNGDTVDLSSWDIDGDDLPIVCQPGETAKLGAIMLSPLAVSVRGQKGRWHDDLTKAGPDLEEAVNFRLSRLTGRDVRLTIEPDRLYLKANPKHSTLVRTRAVRGAKPAFVIGVMCPLLISGPLDDLRSAWVLGIGEKNRYGFGCIGHAGGVV